MKPKPYQPDYNENRVGYCSHESCGQYDGKRCRLTGFQPHGVCEPWAIDAARDHAAMDVIRTMEGELTTVGYVEGFDVGWFADVGTWGQAEDGDPAEAIMKAYAVEVDRMKNNPVESEHRG